MTGLTAARARRSRIGRIAVVASTVALIAATIVSSPAAEAGSVTVHVGCPGGTSNVDKLIQAVRDANARAPQKTILYLGSSCNYAFLRGHSFPAPFGANALPVVRAHLVIHGQGATISRRLGAPRFRLLAVAMNGTVSIDHLTLANGRARNGRAGA